MRRTVLGSLLVVLAACSPSNPGDYADNYGGSEAQYEALLTSDDCAWLADTAEEMDERYDRERDRVAFGYQSAAVDRMVEINC